MDNVIVPAWGRKPNHVALVGEAPGKEEAAKRRPFVGKSGEEQEAYLAKHGLSAKFWWMSNVCPEYTDGNPDPTPDKIEHYTPLLEEDLQEVRPLLVIAVGRFAARWFLGEEAEMEAVHGIPHLAGAFDPSRRHRAAGAVVLPIYHPAAGFYKDDARVQIAWDYEQVAKTLRLIEAGKPLPRLEDQFRGRERYEAITGDGMRTLLAPAWHHKDEPISLDTEGIPSDPWSIQVSTQPGTGYCLRKSEPDFAVGVAALQEAADRGCLIVLHNGMYDIEMCRAQGLELKDARLWDSMYAAFITRLEPQGLKHLAYRWTGMRMTSYEETVGDVGREKQINWLSDAMAYDWGKPEPRLVFENDGTAHMYKPQPLNQRIIKILNDVYDKGADPHDRWKQVDDELRAQAEDVLGPMPIGTLADIPLDRAVAYSCRDSDATLRLYHVLGPELERRGLTPLMENGCDLIPVFEEMQYHGMPASRRYFAGLHDRMTERMSVLQSRISFRYNGGRPFNPASPDQVRSLMNRRGLRGATKTKTGKMSTGKKSIEHLRPLDDAIDLIVEWREHQKVRDAFCQPVLDRIPPDRDLYPMRCNIKVTRVHTRRLAASDPNLLGIPVRTDLGRLVREGYQCPPGFVFGAWDYSQIEMRVMAHLSQDPRLIAAFNDPKMDIHCEVACAIFGLKVNEGAATKKERYANVDDMDHRYPAKRAGFGIITNIQGSGLYDQLRMAGCKGWSEDRCDELIEFWLDYYAGVKRYLADAKRLARVKGMVRDEWGMPRFLPGVYATDRKVRAEAERAASSHMISGTAQGMIQNAMRHLRPQIRELQRDLGDDNLHWSLQIHDEVIFYMPEGFEPVIDEMVRDSFKNHHGLRGFRVPVDCDGHTATNWGKLK